jgi:MFS family permease
MQTMHRQVFLLATAQALFQIVTVLVMTIGGLAGSILAPSPEFATAPVAAMFLGTAVSTVPASMLMTRLGRKLGFVTGASLGTLGGVLAAGGMATSSIALLCAGTFLAGCYQGFAQFYRFAAGEIADDNFRPRAISLVLGGGVVAALVGPLLARWGGDLMQPMYTASFLFLTAASALAVGVLLAVDLPKLTDATDGTTTARPLRAIVRQPVYLVALFGAVTGYGVMVLAMTATPLAMTHHQHDLTMTATVIQLHVLGMFLPSFFTGSLIARFGVLRVMLAGVMLLAAHVVFALTGTGFYNFTAALILLGVGWNFLYIGGTNLLTHAYTSAEKGKAQATNDLTIFLAGLAASLSAGFLQQTIGWQSLNLWLLPLLAAAAAAIIWLQIAQKQAMNRA